MMKNRMNGIACLAVFTASASALNIAESFIPMPLPWMKLGLANMITLIALITMGRSFAVSLAVGRVFVSSILLGTLFSPAFYLSISGAVVSALFMALIYRPLGKLSPVGVSVVGAVIHSVTQLSVVMLLFIRHPGISAILPLIMVSSVAAGLINGYLAVKIVPKLAEFADNKIYLASGSPRRREMMMKAGLPVIIIVPDVEEDKPQDGEIPALYALRQAEKKLEAVACHLSPPGCVISADTVVESGGHIFGKPEDVDDAEKMLRLLSGKVQKVHTAVAVINLINGRQLQKTETTSLKMKTLSDVEIRGLKNLNLDKAGAYAIQGMADEYFEWIRGSYTNVVGFPLKTVKALLAEIQQCNKR
ncbi:MAG: Gx transporter family protein [Elusimicrobiota bacterium]